MFNCCVELTVICVFLISRMFFRQPGLFWFQHAEICIYKSPSLLNIFKKIPISYGASPIKLFEYVAMRRLVISTRLREVENIDDGFLYYVDTAEELVKEIQNILKDKNKLIDKLKKGYNTINEYYNWDKIAAELLGIVEHEQKI